MICHRYDLKGIKSFKFLFYVQYLISLILNEDFFFSFNFQQKIKSGLFNLYNKLWYMSSVFHYCDIISCLNYKLIGQKQGFGGRCALVRSK